ncbi:unnamed protein product [Ectocarpus fasciculatus]
MSPRVLLLLSLVLVHDVWLGAAQDSFLVVTSPESGDVFTAGDDVTVEWEASLESSYFDISLLNDGNPVGNQFCDGGCLAPNGFLVVTLPDGLESGSAYSFLVGDRVEEVSSYGESETFEIVSLAISSDTAGEDDTDTEVAAADEAGDGDSFNWVIAIVAIAAALAVVSLCAVLCCCCKRRKNRVKDKEAATVSGSGTSDAAYGGGVVGRDATGGGGGINGDLFASSGGGSSNGGASVSGLAEMGALSPVHEESTEVVTRNPMISAMANGAQFHSTGGGSGNTGGGSAKFNSAGGSSKFASLGGGSSNGGYGSARGGGEEEEEGGGMFADAEVVAELAAAAAKRADKKDGISVKRPGSGSGRWDGNWIKSPAWNRQKPAAAAPTLIGQQSPGPVNAAEAEKKMAEAAAAGDPEPEAAAPAPVEDWMVSTRDSFSSRKSAEAAAFLAATGADEGSVTREESMGEKVEEPEDVGAATPRAPGAGEAHAFSPQSVDGISAKAFEQAEVVTSKLPVVNRPGMVVSEPECEVPKPALSARRLGGARKQSDYSWLLSASPSNAGKSGPISPSGDSLPQASHGRLDVTGPHAGGNTPVNGGKLVIVTGKPAIVTVASVTPAKTRRGLPSTPTADQAPGFAAAPKHGGDLGEASSGPEQRESAAAAAAAAALRLPPKAQGTTPRRTPLRGASRGLNPATTPLAKSPRGPRVSQVVDVFEGLTPKGVGGPSCGFGATPGRSRAIDTPKTAGPPMLAPSPPGIPKAGYALTTPKPPGAVKGMTTPSGPALKVGAATWATPVATPDRASFGTSFPMKKSTRAAAPEDMSKGGHSAAGGDGDAGWATPVATPDRALRAGAPSSSLHGERTPELTARGDASKAGKASGSPMDEGQFAWQLESPAGVDGLPSPMGSSGINALAVGKKGGRIIPAILGAANTPVTEVSPAVTPSTADIKVPSHSVVSSGDSSIGGGWEMGSSFGSSRVAAFVADAQAEAAAEAHAAVVEAQAEAADEQAIEEELARAAAAASGQGTAAMGAAATPSETTSRGAHQQNGLSHTNLTAEVASDQSDGPTDAQAQASEAALAAMAAATAAAEADAAAEDAAAKAAEAAVRAEKAAEQAAKAKAASRRDAGAATATASGKSSVLEAVSPNVVATPETTEGVVAGGGAMGDTVFINEAVGKPPEVYNDADNSDESIIDVGEEVDMGEEKDWMTAASPMPRTPNAASIGEVFAMTPTRAGQEEPMQDFGDEGGAAAVGQQHSENFGSFSSESSSGADTGALHQYGVYDLAGGDAAATATGINEYASSRGSGGGDAATPGVFKSARSILTWKEDDEQEEGDAEREAEEVQALVAEALALVQEANADD